MLPIMNDTSREIIVEKGDRITAQWFNKTRLVGLAGMQMKASMREVTVSGIVAHIRGNHPTEPTISAFFVTLDHELPEGMEELPDTICSCGVSHVLVNPNHVIDVKKKF